MCVYTFLSLSLYIYIYIQRERENGSYSSVVRGYGVGGGGPGFNPHHIKLSGLEVRPFKVSGGSPVHLWSKHRATGSGNRRYRLTESQPTPPNKNNI